MPNELPFDEFLTHLRNGDNQAAVEVCQRYGQRLWAQANTLLDRRLRGQMGPEDVVQSVLKSFFGRAAQGRFEFKDWDGVKGILTLLTARKCKRMSEQWRRQKRDVQREVRLPE